MPDSRELDVVLFGATGFTGGLTAEYLARQGPDGLRWGLAGRNLAKLEQVRDALGEAGAGVELIVATRATRWPWPTWRPVPRWSSRP